MGARFKIAYHNTSKFEGGYVSPEVAASINDPGGETYKGIARNANPKWKGWAIIDALKNQQGKTYKYNGVVYHGLKHNTIIQDASLEDLVQELYYKNYWQPLRLGEFTNQSLANFIYDLHVGSSTGLIAAVKFLQNKLGLVNDGRIGNNTLKAFNTRFNLDLFEQLKEFRIEWLKRAVGNKPYVNNLIERTKKFVYDNPVLPVMLVGMFFFSYC